MPKHNPFGKIGDSSPPESPKAKKSNEPEPERTLLVKHVTTYLKGLKALKEFLLIK